jgi:hypothetical protein
MFQNHHGGMVLSATIYAGRDRDSGFDLHQLTTDADVGGNIRNAGEGSAASGG